MAAEKITKIMIVDDEPTVVSHLEKLLVDKGYDVCPAFDGHQALEKIKQELPQLIVADIMMPKMDGFIFYKELKKNKATAEIPVIILTARSRMVDTFLALGVDAFLAKPCDAKVLLDNIERLILGKGPVITPKEAVAVQKDIVKDIPAPQASPAIPASKKRAVIFGSSEKVIRDMRQQLEKQGCFVAVVQDEAKLIPTVQEIKPDAIFLAVNAETQEPIDKIIHRVNALTPKQKADADPNSSLPKKMHMVLYKIEEETAGIKDSASDLADTESLLQRCSENGASKYIGGYSPFAFISKVQEFLK